MADSSKPRRSSLRTCCLWTTPLLAIILLLAAIAGAIFWAIYSPRRPNFTVSSLQLSQFRLTSTHLNSKFNFIFTAHNPNKKIIFFYDPFSISEHSDNVDIGDGSLPGFVHGPKNTTTFRTVLASSRTGDFSALQSDIKKMKNLPLKIQLDSKVQVKIGSLKTKKAGIRITCDGARLSIPGGKSAITSNVRCKVGLRIKIWEWTV